MMRKNIAFYFIILFYLSNLSFAQQDSTKKFGWFQSGVAGLNVSQIALSNWSQGGDNSLTWTITGDFGLKYVNENFNFDNTLKVAYGRTKSGGQEFRTNDNDFYLVNLVSKNIDDWEIKPYFSNSIRTSITQGYDYSTTPKTEIAAFFDPGYINQSVGFIYDKHKYLTTRLGLGAQEVFTNVNTKYTDDPTTTKVETFKFDLGFESVTTSEVTLAQNLVLKSNLRLFSRFKELSVWDVRWDNALIARINDFMNVNLSFLFVYQKDQSKQGQIKQTLQLGIVYTLF
jgi:hypothetical protein